MLVLECSRARYLVLSCSRALMLVIERSSNTLLVSARVIVFVNALVFVVVECSCSSAPRARLFMSPGCDRALFSYIYIHVNGASISDSSRATAHERTKKLPIVGSVLFNSGI